jgi:hypothetical protein
MGVVSTKVKRPIQNHHVGGSSRYQLPTWFSSKQMSDYSTNLTMPCLELRKRSLLDCLQSLTKKDCKSKGIPEEACQDKKITVGRFGGIYCPVHLAHPEKPTLYVHGSNGVYLGIQVCL